MQPRTASKSQSCLSLLTAEMTGVQSHTLHQTAVCTRQLAHSRCQVCWHCDHGFLCLQNSEQCIFTVYKLREVFSYSSQKRPSQNSIPSSCFPDVSSSGLDQNVTSSPHRKTFPQDLGNASHYFEVFLPLLGGRRNIVGQSVSHPFIEILTWYQTLGI